MRHRERSFALAAEEVDREQENVDDVEEDAGGDQDGAVASCPPARLRSCVVSRVMRCLHATTPEDLHEIGGWAHDAYFAWEEVRLDAVRRTVVVPFAQEPPDDIDAPRAELIREHRVGGSVFKVPFLRYRLVVREATGCEIAAEGREDPGMLLSLTFDADAGVVQVDAGMGPDVRIAVDEIDADIEVTDEIALYVRRAGGFERHWREGDADRPSEIDVLGLARRLVARLRR